MQDISSTSQSTLQDLKSLTQAYPIPSQHKLALSYGVLYSFDPKKFIKPIMNPVFNDIKLKNSTNLSLHMIHVNDMKMDYISKALRLHSSNLEHLKLELEVQVSSFTAIGLQRLHKGLKDTVSDLKTLTIHFNRAESIIRKASVLEVIGKAIRGKCQNLEVLDIAVVNETNYNYKGMKAISAALKAGCMSLKRLSLKHCNYQIPWSIDLNSFSNALNRTLPELQILELSLNHAKQVTPGSFYNFSKTLENRKDCKIEKVKLDFSSSRIQDSDLIALSQGIEKGLPNLTGFSLNLERCRMITDAGIEAICKALASKMHRLQEFELNCNDCEQITDKTLQTLKESLKVEISILKDFKIELTSCPKITKEGIVALSALFGSGALTKIENLQLKLDKLDDTIIQAISRDIQFSLLKLKALGILGNECGSLTSHGMNTLNSAIGELSGSLEHIDFSFRGSAIDKESLINLGGVLSSENINLRHLRLDFARGFQIDDEGIVAISKAVDRKMKDIFNINLCFDYCKKVTGVSIKAFTEIFKTRATNLKSACIGFNDVHIYTKNEIRNYLREAIEKALGKTGDKTAK